MIALFAAESTPHISLPAEPIFTVFGFPITNSMITSVIGYALLLWMLFFVAGKVKKGNKNRFASMIQWIFEMLYETVEQVAGDKKLAKKIAPISITMFFFILLQYWVGILPFVGEVFTWNGVPLFRGAIADLNVTFALAIITIVLAQVYAIKELGTMGNIKRYIRNPLKDPAGAFEGFLELIAEFSRGLALSFRLFGNVFAGEILLMMVAFLTTYAAPVALLPFYVFELFIGAIQAYIFFMLTTVFISLGVAHGEHGDEAHSNDHSTPKSAKLAATGNDT
ncbi:MAG: F0F1 ATP synthase subunit A [Candidatus Saccharimonadales bacterium]